MILEGKLPPCITNQTLHKIHQPHDSQINKGPNNFFPCYSTKSIAYIKETNYTTWILIAIDVDSCFYEYVFTKLYIHIGVNISKSLSINIHITNTRSKYDRR